MAVYPTTNEALEDFIIRVTQDATAALIDALGKNLKEEIPGMIEEYASVRFDEVSARVETAKQRASEEVEAVRVTSAQALGEADVRLSRAVQEMKEVVDAHTNAVAELESQNVGLLAKVKDLQATVDQSAQSSEVETMIGAAIDKMQDRVQQATDVAKTQVMNIIQTVKAENEKLVHTLAMDTHRMVGELHARTDAIVSQQATHDEGPAPAPDEPVGQGFATPPTTAPTQELAKSSSSTPAPTGKFASGWSTSRAASTLSAAPLSTVARRHPSSQRHRRAM